MAWYDAGSGATCVAAYNPVGASSLANSYVNLVSPGTNNAAPGVAPTWAYGTGWTFSGAQRLTTGVTVSSNAWSMIVRFSGGQGAGANALLCGQYLGGSAQDFSLWQVTASKSYYVNRALLASPTLYTSGVLAMAGKNAYANGVSDGTIGAGVVAGAVVGIGATTGGTWWYVGNIQALAIYSSTLTAADVLAITNAMNALPAAKGLPVIEHWHDTMYLR